MYNDDPKKVRSNRIQGAVIALFGCGLTYLGLEYLPAYWGLLGLAVVAFGIVMVLFPEYIETGSGSSGNGGD